MQRFSLFPFSYDLQAVSERPHQAKQFHVRFIEREVGVGKVTVEREVGGRGRGEREGKMRETRGAFIFFDCCVHVFYGIFCT